MFQGTRLRTKLLMALLAMSSIPLLVIGTLSITTSNKALSELAFGQLESLRDVKRTHIQRFFEERLGDMEVLLQTVTVFEQTAFAKMRSVQEVKKAQVEEYFRKFRADITVLATNVNLFKMKDFELLLDGQGGVRLATLDMYETQYFGTSLRQLARDYGYDDLLLITDQGNVVYTVARGPDLGQNLLTGPLKQSSLAACFKKGLKEVTIEDFAPYPPLKNQPMAFIAAPVVNTQLNITIGVVVFRISHRAMNTIVHRREGMGVSGETFLAGRLHEINSLRSDQIVRDGRVGEDVADGKIDRMLSGVSGAVVGMGRTGTMEISHYDPLNIVGLNWGIITAMSLEEAITPTLAGGNGDYFSQFIHQYGYSDLLLIHPDGTVFYTVAYNTDYGTNLKDGPHVATGLGQVFRQVLKSKAFSFADFQPYAPFAGKPVAFMAQPVMKNDTVELIVAVQIPIDAINAVMQERSGMGLTGETYLVGPDQLMRSDSYADPERFAVAASFAHPETGRVDTQASREALAGKTGQGRITNYLGKPVLSAYAPLKIWDVNWALIAEMNTDEAFAAVQKLSALISGVGIIVLAGIVVFSLILTGYITKPIHQLVQLAQKVSAGDLSITLQDKRPGRDEIGILIQAFNAMIRQLRQSFETLEERVVVRTHELNDSNQQLQIAKDAAETANRAKSDFLSRMSHELRTPLNAILGYAQILKHHNNLFEAQRQQLDIMRSSGEHLLTLINDILDVGKIEASKMEVEDLAFDLPALMGQVFDLTKLQAEEKTLSFQYEADTPLPAYVRGDERKLRQILLNLLSNAVKYTSRGSVTMRVSYTAAGLFRCEVIDTGIGIPEDKLEAIFEPFTQLATDRQVREGTGLGLNISKLLLALIQGRMGVESVVGTGSTFWLEVALPSLLDTEIVLETKQYRIVGYRGERKRILVVDDTVGNSAMLVSLLEPLGFELDTVQNGREALLEVSGQRPDLVLLDLVMPEMDGLEVAMLLRQNPDLATVRIIGTSATVTDNARKEEFIALCDDFVAKPIRIDLLLGKIGALLGIEWETALPRAAGEANGRKSGRCEEPIVAPQPTEMEGLYELAMLGDMLKIEAWATALEAKNSMYRCFADRLRELARGFKTKAILTLVEQYRGDGT